MIRTIILSSHLYLKTFLLLRLNWRLNFLIVLVQATSWQVVQAKDVLVGILDEYVLALSLLQAHIGDCPHDTPAVGQLQVHLVGKVPWLPANNTKDDVSVVALGVHTGNEAVEWEKKKSQQAWSTT